METTRHFVATTFIVEGGATALHRHDGLDMLLPPGGHVERGECPHEAAVREVREETGLSPTLLTEARGIDAEGAHSIPRPRHLLLEDINVHAGEVGHQHIDHVYYATVDSRDIDPAPGEAPADAWDWYDLAALESAELTGGVRGPAMEAIEAVEASRE